MFEGFRAKKNTGKTFAVKKTDQEWEKELDPFVFQVMRNGKTEPAFTGDLLELKADGSYVCASCGHKLFSSDKKFDSGTGWPSFSDAEPFALGVNIDRNFGITRLEIHCANCGGHLGHTFEDRRQMTGVRHCVNSASLKFRPARARNGTDK